MSAAGNGAYSGVGRLMGYLSTRRRMKNTISRQEMFAR